MKEEDYFNLISKNSGLSVEEVKNYYLETYTGIKFPIFNPDPQLVELKDIAVSLSMQCRHNGHLTDFYSVAQHCYEMAKLSIKLGFSTEISFKALLHDASEAYISDIPKPVKIGLKKVVDPLEDKLLNTIFDSFGIDSNMPSRIKKMDNFLFDLEKKNFCGWVDDTAQPSQINGILMDSIEPMGIDESQERFIEMFDLLESRLNSIEES